MTPPLGSASLAASPRGAMSQLLRGELRREWRMVTISLVVTLLGSIAIAIGPTLVQRAIDDGIAAGDSTVLAVSVAIYVAARVFGGVCSGIRGTAMGFGTERAIDRLRVASLSGIMRLDLRRFEQLRRGDLLARVSADTESLSAASRWALPAAFGYSCDLVAAFVAVALLDPLLALLTLVAVPPMAAAGRALRVRSAVVYPRYRAEVGALVGQISETVEGAETVTAYGRVDDRLAMLDAANQRVTDRYMDGTTMRNRFYASITMTRVTATAIVLIAASLLAVGGRITVGTAAAGVLAVSTVFGPLSWLTELLDEVLSARAALDRVVATTVIAHDGGIERLPAAGALAMTGVTFGYDPARPVLRDVSLRLEPGSRTAVVGPTGAGKSTLARLLAGLTHPDSGTVSFDGVDLRDADPGERGRRLTYVLQEPFVLTGTIADNMRLVAPDATDAELIDVAANVGLDGWLAAHPDGLHRGTGPSGAALSSGERQLVGILRLAAADPAVAILDEATAVLDPVTEALVGPALDRALAHRTVVVIAHRPETAARAHRVVHVSTAGVRLDIADAANPN